MVWPYPPVFVRDAVSKRSLLFRYLYISGNSVFGLNVYKSETLVVVVSVLKVPLVTRVLHTCGWNIVMDV